MRASRLLSTLTALAALTSVARAQGPAETTTPPPEGDPSTTAAAPDAPTGDVPLAIPGEETFAMPAGDAGGALTEAELAQLGFGGGAAAAVDTSLKFSGFMDFSSSVLAVKKDSPWRGSVDRYQSFWLGNFNLYISKNLTENIRSFGEVRFTYLPNGTRAAGNPQGPLTNTTVGDYNDFSNKMRWGGIEIERAYLEWTAHRYLTIRAGSFLTPYGIWNVDHGSPTIITVQRPYAVGLQLFPERQTGIELFGRYDVENGVVGYHLTVSNGNGPISEYRDLDRNKAVGGRAYWTYNGLGEFRVGGSVYYGRDTTATEIVGLTSTGRLRSTENIVMQADALSLAVDILWRYAGFHAQAEFISQQKRYTGKGRVGSVFPLTGTFTAPNDDLSYGMYGLVGYRFDWLGVMPYFMLSNFDSTDPSTHFRSNSIGISGGVNIRPVDAVVLKIEYTGGWQPDGHFYADDFIGYMQAQLAWAF